MGTILQRDANAMPNTLWEEVKVSVFWFHRVRENISKLKILCGIILMQRVVSCADVLLGCHVFFPSLEGKDHYLELLQRRVCRGLQLHSYLQALSFYDGNSKYNTTTWSHHKWLACRATLKDIQYCFKTVLAYNLKLINSKI